MNQATVQLEVLEKPRVKEKAKHKRPVALKDNLVEFFEQKGWEYKVLGRAEMPEAISYLGNWIIVPSDLDASDIPDHAMDKVSAIFGRGFRPKGFVLVHEITEKDAANHPNTAFSVPRKDWFEQVETSRKRKVDARPQPDFRKVVKSLAPVADIMGTLIKLALIVGAVAIGLIVLVNIVQALLAGGIVILGLFALAVMAGLDPVLVVVSDDNYWIEIDRWED